MAKVVEVSVFKPAAGKLDEYLSVAKDFKAYVLGAGVEEVWFNTGSVGRHFGCVVGYQVVANSMCDISDGLVSDAGNIAKASGVNIDLSKELLQKSDDYKDLAELASELGEDVFDWILTGGEDHFFLATVSADKASDDLGLLVGKVEAGSGVVNLDGKAITKAGYQHF